MEAVAVNSELTLTEVREFVQSWFKQSSFQNVNLVENLNPLDTGEQRYRIIYECKFLPNNLEQAEFELWLSEDGEVSVGIDTVERVLKRKGIESKNKRSLSGFEPHKVSLSSLKFVLELVSSGNIQALMTRVPLLGYIDFRMGVELTTLKKIDEIKLPFNWIREMSRSGFLTDVHTYQSWS